MSLMAKCTACGQQFSAPPQFAGKRVKCKACGEIFVVQVLDQNESAQGDGLAPYSNVAATVGSQSKVKTTAEGETGRIGPKNEKRIERGKDVKPFEFVESEFKADLRPNVLIFNFPYAWQLDQWLPLGLIVLSLGIYCIFAGQQEIPIRWVALTRFVLPMLLYWLVIFPITLRLLKKAGDTLGYQMPPQVSLRSFSAFAPAFAFAAGLWLVSDSVVSAVLGIMVGVGVSSAALWILFRLREPDLPTSIGYGAGGFGIGVAASVVVLLVLNLITSLIISAAKAEAKVPLSPYGPNLAWVVVPPPPPATKPAQPTQTVAAAPATPVATSAVATFEQGKIPGRIDEVVRPFSQSSIIGVVRKQDNNAVLVEPWDTQGWKKLPGSLQLPARPGGRFVINTTGQRLAWIAQFPHLSIQVWSFASASVAFTIDLDKNLGEPRLLGFTSANNLLIEWLPSANSGAEPPTSDAKPDPAASAAPANQSGGSDVVVGSRVFVDTPGSPAPAPAPSPAPAPPPSPVASAAPETPAPSPTLDLFSVPARASILKFKIPPLAAPLDSDQGRAIFAISTTAQRFVAAAKSQNTPPTLFQFDLKTGEAMPSIKIAEVDPTMSPAPTGLAYSLDGNRLAVLFEHDGSALLQAYDSVTGTKVLGNGFVYPSGPLDGAPHDPFLGSAIAWLDPWPYWLVYGRGLLSTQTGAHLKPADLVVEHTISQRVLEDGRVELLTAAKDGLQITIATLDKDKIDAATSSPTP